MTASTIAAPRRCATSTPAARSRGLQAGETVVMMPPRQDGPGRSRRRRMQDAPWMSPLIDAAIRGRRVSPRVVARPVRWRKLAALTETASAADGRMDQERDDPTLRCEPPGLATSIMPNPIPGSSWHKRRHQRCRWRMGQHKDLHMGIRGTGHPGASLMGYSVSLGRRHAGRGNSRISYRSTT